MPKVTRKVKNVPVVESKTDEKIFIFFKWIDTNQLSVESIDKFKKMLAKKDDSAKNMNIDDLYQIKTTNNKIYDVEILAKGLEKEMLNAMAAHKMELQKEDSETLLSSDNDDDLDNDSSDDVNTERLLKSIEAEKNGKVKGKRGRPRNKIYSSSDEELEVDSASYQLKKIRADVAEGLSLAKESHDILKDILQLGKEMTTYVKSKSSEEMQSTTFKKRFDDSQSSSSWAVLRGDVDDFRNATPSPEPTGTVQPASSQAPPPPRAPPTRALIPLPSQRVTSAPPPQPHRALTAPSPSPSDSILSSGHLQDVEIPPELSVIEARSPQRLALKLVPLIFTKSEMQTCLFPPINTTRTRRGALPTRGVELLKACLSAKFSDGIKWPKVKACVDQKCRDSKPSTGANNQQVQLPALQNGVIQH